MFLVLNQSFGNLIIFYVHTISLKLGQPEFAVIVIEKNFLKSKKCVNSSGREYLTPNVANFVETYDQLAHSLRFSKSELSTQKDRKPSII